MEGKGTEKEREKERKEDLNGRERDRKGGGNVESKGQARKRKGGGMERQWKGYEKARSNFLGPFWGPNST